MLAETGSEDRSYCVYLHRKADTGDIFYVGSGTRLRPRHFWAGRRAEWRAVREKHGVHVEVILDGLTKEESLREESRLIAELGKTVALVNKARVESRKEEIKEFFSSLGRFPSHRREEEKKLQQLLAAYCRPNHSSYDPEFHAWAKSVGYGSTNGIARQRCEQRKREIKEFVETNNRFPSVSVPEEEPLIRRTGTYCCKASSAYDAEFDEWCRDRGYGKNKRR